mmetsp:Transcript_57450/g.181916  ORF Transcript_57450/g.181916 Transcript_57450/m.181916 type:complete len:89 (+) Transcript_57450:4400-4666(+)
MGCDSCCGMVCCCSRAEAGKIKYVYFFGFLVTACLMWGLRDYPVDAWVNLPGTERPPPRARHAALPLRAGQALCLLLGAFVPGEVDGR